jgi:HAD superfamily hydrolase (TIGR01509 family)
VSEFRGVLFDAGDTLIRLSDNGEHLLERAAASLGFAGLDADEATKVWQEVLRRASTPEELAKGRDLSAQRHRDVWTQLYLSAGCDRLASGLSDALYAMTIDPQTWEAFPDTLSTLRVLHEQGLRLGVVSDTGFDMRPVFDALGLTEYFDAVVLSFEHGVCKPDPSLFRSACDDLGVPPDETLMVGDNPFTDSGAVSAGLPVLLLPPPRRSGPRGLRHVLSLCAPPGAAATP